VDAPFRIDEQRLTRLQASATHQTHKAAPEGTGHLTLVRKGAGARLIDNRDMDTKAP